MKKILRVILFFLSLVPVLWFLGKPDVLINGIDTNFPLNPWVWFQRRFFVWSNIPNAGADFSSSIAGLFFHAIQVIPYAIGLKLQIVEIFSLVFWFGAIIFGSYILAKKVMPKRPLIQLVFVVLYSFNIYIFNSWENIKVSNIALVASIPFAVYLLIRLREGSLSYSKSALLACIVGLLLSGSGINPAYFICLIAILFIFLLSAILADFRKKETLKRLKEFLWISVFILFVNSFWLLPTINFIFQSISPNQSIAEIGYTNWVDSLSENTSLLNVLRIQGAWDWYAYDSQSGLPLYIPYAGRFFKDPLFIAFSILIPALALISLIIRKSKFNFLYCFWGILAVLGVFLGAGTHQPTGFLFKLLLKYLPFFSLFRSPWYIFTPMLTFAYAGLVSLLFYNLTNIFEKIKILPAKVLFYAVLISVIAGNLLYCYPLITGKIFRPLRHDGFFIKFPNYIFDAAKWLASADLNGRLITYPDDEIENFKWGYRGIESVIGLISTKEILYPPLNAVPTGVDKIIRHFYSTLKKEELVAAARIAAKLNAGYLFEKNDQQTLAFDILITDPLQPLAEFGEWNFYEFQENYRLPKIFAAQQFVFARPYDKTHEVFGVLPVNTHVLNPADTIVKQLPDIMNTAGQVVLANNESTTHAKYTFSVETPGDYSAFLERYKVEDFGISTSDNLQVLLDGVPRTWSPESVDDSHIKFHKVSLAKGDHVLEIFLANENLITGGDFQKGQEFEKSVNSSKDSRFDIEEDEDGRYLRILNLGDKDISAKFRVAKFDPKAAYLIKLRYQHVYGNNAQVLTAQNNKNTLVKTQVEKLPNYPGWRDYIYYYTPVLTESEMSVNLIAALTDDPLGTTVYYDDLYVQKLFTNNLILLNSTEESVSSPGVSYEQISPVSYKIRVTNANSPHTIIFSENYSNLWEFESSGIDAQHFSANLYANAWHIKSSPQEYEATIRYKPQEYLKIGVCVSISAFALSLFLYFKSKQNSK